MIARIKRSWRVRVASWLLAKEKDQYGDGCAPSNPYDATDDVSAPGEVKLVIKPAMNGRVITMMHLKPGGKPDWQNTVYLVPSGEDLIKAITVLLVSASVGK